MFNGVVLADFHLGHSKVSVKHQHETIRQFLYPALTADCDVFIVAGDFYDTSLLFDHEAAIRATVIEHDLCSICKHHNIPIRLLRGTYSHDRDQLRQFAEIANYHKLDCKYFDAISVDKLHDLTFLYLPDTLPYKDRDDILTESRKLLKDTYHTTIPDIVIGHGYFDHRIPEQVRKPACCYPVEAFAQSKLVIFGHEHKHWNVQNVYSSGSFDRLAHGEEDPKGFVRFRISEGQVSVRFVENVCAVPHITIDAVGNTVDEKFCYITDQVEKRFPHPPFGYLRIRDGSEERTILASLLAEKYSNVLTVTSIDAKTKQQTQKKSSLSLNFTVYHTDIPQPETIGAQLWDFVQSTRGTVSVTQEAFLTGVKELQRAIE